MQDPTKRIVKDQSGFKAEKSDYVLAKGPDGKRVWINKLTGEMKPYGDDAGTAPAPAPASSSSADTMAQMKIQLQLQAQMQMQATMQDLANKFKAIDGSSPPDSALDAFRSASGSVAAMVEPTAMPAAWNPAAMGQVAVTPAAPPAAMTPAEMGQATMAMAQAATMNPPPMTPAQMGQAAMAQAALCQSAMPPGLAAMNAVSNASSGLFAPPGLDLMPAGLAAMMAAGEAAGLGPMPPGLAAMMAGGGTPDMANMAFHTQQAAASSFLLPAAPAQKKMMLAPELAARLGVPRPPAPSASFAGSSEPDVSKGLVCIPATAFQVITPQPTFVQQPAADNKVVNTGKVRIMTGKVGGAPAGSDRLQQEMQRIQAGMSSGGSDATDAPFAGGEDNSMDLDYDLMAGTITQEEYDAKMAELNPGAAALAAAAATNAAPDFSGMAGMDAGSLMAAMAAQMGADGGEVDGAALAQAMQAAMNAGACQPGGEGGDASTDPEHQAGMDVAMAAQMMQLNRFHMQQRVFETQKCIASGDMPTRFKEGFRPMQLCKQFVKSATCVRGETCSYAHTFEELHPMSPNLPGAQSAKAMEALEEEHMPADTNIPEPVMRMQRKRAMCQRLHRGGCLLAEKCPFAHSESELGTVALAITDRVKTHICKFFAQGKCVYAKYCVNAHGPHEIGKPKPEYLCPPSKANDPRDKELERGRGNERDYREDRDKRDRSRR